MRVDTSLLLHHTQERERKLMQKPQEIIDVEEDKLLKCKMMSGRDFFDVLIVIQHS